MPEGYRQEVIAIAGAYVVVLGGLVLWPGRTGLNQDLLILFGMAAVFLAAAVIERLLFRQWPRFEFAKRRRPLRYSLPNVVGLFAALSIGGAIRSGDDPDRGLLTFGIALPLIVLGAVASDLLWTRGTRWLPGPAVTPLPAD